MRERVCAGDVPTLLADESDELRLIVKLIRAVRADHWGVVTNERGCRAEKDHRIVRGLGAALGRMIDIVQAKANDFAAAHGGRKRLQIGDRQAGSAGSGCRDQRLLSIRTTSQQIRNGLGSSRSACERSTTSLPSRIPNRAFP